MEVRDETWLYRRASDQHGVFSRAQAVQARLSDDAIGRRVRAGRWERLYPGVYRLVGSPRTPESAVAAALAWAGPTSALSHRSAAAVWGFERFRAAPATVSITVARRTTAPRGIRLHRGAGGVRAT